MSFPLLFKYFDAFYPFSVWLTVVLGVFDAVLPFFSVVESCLRYFRRFFYLLSVWLTVLTLLYLLSVWLTVVRSIFDDFLPFVCVVDKC